jgi:ParB family chromosome partitioning protein
MLRQPAVRKTKPPRHIKLRPSAADYGKLAPRAAPNGTLEVDVAGISIGKRHRREMGNIAEPAANIEELGLLQPIVIDRSTGKLVAGKRRILAYQRLGRDRIPATFINIDDIVAGEFAENAYRKDFAPSELVAIGEEVERRERERAKERQRDAGRTKASGNFPEAGQARDKIGARLGISGRAYERAKAVVVAAEAEPEKYGKLLADMDRTGRANGPYRRLQNAKRAEQIRAEPPPLPGKGPYRGGMIDIPWAYEPDDENAPHRGVLPYPSSRHVRCRLPRSCTQTPCWRFGLPTSSSSTGGTLNWCARGDSSQRP